MGPDLTNPWDQIEQIYGTRLNEYRDMVEQRRRGSATSLQQELSHKINRSLFKRNCFLNLLAFFYYFLILILLVTISIILKGVNPDQNNFEKMWNTFFVRFGAS